MWIVRFALRRPYSIVALVITIIVLSVLSIRTMQVDVLPSIDMPAVGVLWNYAGLSPEDMERRIVLINERLISSTVDSVERIESISTPGLGLIRIYFQQGTDLSMAVAQLTSACAGLARFIPPGTPMPTILPINASSVPVGQLTVFSEILSDSELFDFTNNFLRVKIFAIPGISVPIPYGGRNRMVNINVDPNKLYANGLSPTDISNSLQAMNLISPAGTARLGELDYAVAMNSSPSSVELFSQIPIRTVHGASLVLGDVAKVFDGPSTQTQLVRINGRRAVYLDILKKSSSSTVSVIGSIKSMLPALRDFVPKGVKLDLDFDQSTYVISAIENILKEAAASSVLVSVMILLFLRSWRSVIVVCTSIPLAILVAIIGLKMAGYSINIMTLGGLSLAIGMLVDDATVEVENIHRNLALGSSLTVSILNGAQQVALPAIIATLSICIVFSPVMLLTGPSRFLFMPMAAAVVFAMAASYFLSRTLVPLLSKKMLSTERAGAVHEGETSHGLFATIQSYYLAILNVVMHYRWQSLIAFATFLALTGGLSKMIGTDFFPVSDAGLIKIHFRAPSGSRIETTEKLVAQAEQTIKNVIPERDLRTINSMIGVPPSYNSLVVPTENVSGMDAEILISLNPDHAPSNQYVKKIRYEFSRQFVSSSFNFLPADLVSQVLNFGMSSPIDVQIEGSDFNKSIDYARRLQAKMELVNGMVDVGLKQIMDYPTLKINVDRIKASNFGLSQKDVTSTVLISLSTSNIYAPSFYLNPSNSVSYPVAVQVPPERINSLEDLLSLPVTSSSGTSELRSPSSLRTATETLRNVAEVSTTTTLGAVSHSNVQRVLNLTAGIEGRDLGSVVGDLKAAIASLGTLPSGTKISIRGQSQIMEESFERMGYGLILAVLLVYLLMLVLYQSFIDPIIVMSAIPGAIAGVIWSLALTHTTVNVQSLMGAIMAIGISTSNSILLVSFANDWRVETGGSALDAALAAGRARLRPVVMTALAMIIGMLPAAVGWGEGGEQIAPLGRAVVGGLIAATIATLLIIPIMYAIFRRQPPRSHLLDRQLAQEEAGV